MELQAAQAEGAPGPPTSPDFDKKSAMGGHSLDALRYDMLSTYGSHYTLERKDESYFAADGTYMHWSA
jgi:hypothetical protein